MLVCAPYPRFTLGSGERLPWIISKDTSLRKTLGAWQKVFGSKKIKAEVEGATQEVLTPRKARNSWRGQLNRRAALSVLSDRNDALSTARRSESSFALSLELGR